MQTAELQNLSSKIDDIRTEYRREELGIGVRGKYYESYKKGHNLVLLEPEVAKVFPTDKAVNDALMSLIKVAQASTSKTNTPVHSY
jgi:oligoribonuclease NrnB/cAMP/cGMP phosphodiesterase (DHH superfamily)